ncbi:hypothetical protein K438DRAFT_2135893 [Mycena galopus ATCC 62051]|nr:hypothetical protein K438DRAFT_2135893 [Mycena galopus ATCC 62051]
MTRSATGPQQPQRRPPNPMRSEGLRVALCGFESARQSASCATLDGPPPRAPTLFGTSNLDPASLDITTRASRQTPRRLAGDLWGFMSIFRNSSDLRLSSLIPGAGDAHRTSGSRAGGMINSLYARATTVSTPTPAQGRSRSSVTPSAFLLREQLASSLLEGDGQGPARPAAFGPWGGACFGAQRARGREFNGVDDLGVYSPAPVADDGLVHVALDLDAEPFTPPRTSTPPHPSHFYFHFSPSAFLCSPLSPRRGGIDILTTALMLIAVSTAHIYPLPSAQTRLKSRRRLPRLSSPFFLPLGRSVSASASA